MGLGSDTVSFSGSKVAAQPNFVQKLLKASIIPLAASIPLVANNLRNSKKKESFFL